MTLIIRFSLCCLLSGFVLIGCKHQKLPDDIPQLHNVSVTVLQDTKPTEKALVMFYPIDKNSRWTAGGQTNGNGAVKLMTHGLYQGVVAGEYYVTISKIWTNENATEKIDANTMIHQRYHLIDPKFELPETTPLKIQIEKETSISFDVGQAVKIRIPYVQ
ncbi:MAG: hypothetical protein LBI18_14745 [Planctomycetaceae bacterium]|nr:hypothetical protein [Planctomycetaceae bacterium]